MTHTESIPLWTIQKEEAWEVAKQNSVLLADPAYIPLDFVEPYIWMSEQMRLRIPSYNVAFPVWATPYIKPDLRQSQFNKGTKGVRIAFSAPASDILLSHKTAWEAVLSGHNISLTEDEDEQFNEGNDFFSVWHRPEANPERAEKVKQSWQRIFDLETLAAHANWLGEPNLQATLGFITLDQVTDVKAFVSR